MRLMLNFSTRLGPRTLICEVSDVETAWAVASAHTAAGGEANLLEEMPRMSMKEHLAKHKRRRKVKPKLPVNVTPIHAKRG